MALWSRAQAPLVQASPAIMQRPSVEPDLIRDGSLFVGLLCGIGEAIGILPVPIDARLNWLAGGWLAHLYPERWDDAGTSVFVYPPPLAILASALHAIPFELYLVLMSTLLFGCLWYCAGRWTPAILLAGVLGIAVPNLGPLHVPPATPNGNIQPALAAAVVVALRHPAAGLADLIKIDQGRARGTWSVGWRLARAGGDGHIVGTRRRRGGMADYRVVQRTPTCRSRRGRLYRTVAMSVLIAWGASTNRAWTVPIGVGWAMPALYPWTFLGIWVGAIRLSGIDQVSLCAALGLTRGIVCYRCGWAATVRTRRLAPFPACGECGGPTGVERRTMARESMLGRRAIDPAPTPSTIA
jgi:hypothetical protein